MIVVDKESDVGVLDVTVGVPNCRHPPRGDVEMSRTLFYTSARMFYLPVEDILMPLPDLLDLLLTITHEKSPLPIVTIIVLLGKDDVNLCFGYSGERSSVDELCRRVLP